MGRRVAEKNTRGPAAAKGRRRGRAFKPGVSGNPAGRPRGVPNKVTRIAKELCAGFVNDPTYQAAFRKAFLARTIDPQLEVLVWHYAFGKPPQAVDVALTFDHVAYLASKTAADA